MKYTILVVEDNKALLRLVKSILTRGECGEDCGARPDYEVLCASSATEALRIGMEYPGPIHLLLADVMMPDMLGTEVASLLKAARPSIRVILMSGYPDGKLAVLDAGWQFLQKPFMGEALLARVRIALTAQAAGGR